MADEIAIALPDGSPVAASAATASDSAPADSHKRKLEDLELNNVPEPPTEPEPSSNADALKNGTQEDDNGGADESETKRPRIESNGDNMETDALVSQNGHQEEERKIDGSKEEEYEKPDSADANVKEEEKKYERKEEGSEHPESAGSDVKPVEDQEPPKEPIETITQEPVLGEIENEKTEIPITDENEKTEIPSTDEIGKPNADVEEPSEIPRDGDVPVHTDERQSGSQILSRKLEVSNDRVGVLIGKAGDTIRSLQDNSGAKIQIMRDADADPRSTTRPLELVGTLDDINKAERLIKDVIAEADAGGSPSLVARGFNTVQAASGGEQVEIKVPIEKVGLIIGKGGETIRNLQARSGARIQLIQQNSDGEQSKERFVRITGNKKHIENAREMIKDVMNQTVRPSPLSSGYSHQQGYHPRGPVAPQWGSRGPHHAQFSGYDYPQRGPYPSQNSQYLPPSYGNNYPPPHAPRSNYGPSWEQRPPSLHAQGNYNYGQHPGPEYGHPPAYSQTPAQSYEAAKYDNHPPPAQHYGPQPTPYAAQGGGVTVTHSGYGPPQDQYSKPPMYPMQQTQVPQPYSQPRPTNHPGEVPYQGPVSSAQSYAQNMPPQQPYPQQSYPNLPQQPAHAYPSYGSYPTSQPGYAEQQPASAGYGYQASVDPAAGPQAQTAVGPAGYAAQTQPTYDQSGGYGNLAPAPAPVVGYGKTASPQPGYAPPQYDANQMYGHR